MNDATYKRDPKVTAEKRRGENENVPACFLEKDHYSQPRLLLTGNANRAFCLRDRVDLPLPPSTT